MSILHVSTIGELHSFRPDGAPLEARNGIFSAQRYGSGPDGVLVTYGIQGEGYFRGIREHFHTITAGTKCVMGYIWPRHVRIYARALRGLARVEEAFRGYPYGEDGPEMVWVQIWPLRE